MRGRPGCRGAGRGRDRRGCGRGGARGSRWRGRRRRWSGGSGCSGGCAPGGVRPWSVAMRPAVRTWTPGVRTVSGQPPFRVRRYSSSWMAARVSASMPLWSCHWEVTRRSRTGSARAVEVAGVVGGEVLQAELGVLHGGEGFGAAEPVQPLAAGGAVAEQVEEDLGAGLSGADDGDVPGGEERLAVVEVVGGVDDGDGGRVDEGASGSGTSGSVPMPRTMFLAYVRPRASASPVGVELGEVDLEDIAFGVEADGVDLVAEGSPGRLSADPAAVGVVLGALDVEALGEVEGEEPVAGPEVAEEDQGLAGSARVTRSARNGTWMREPSMRSPGCQEKAGRCS